MEFHWGKHHRTYVSNMNKQIEGTDKESKSLEEVRQLLTCSAKSLPCSARCEELLLSVIAVPRAVVSTVAVRCCWCGARAALLAACCWSTALHVQLDCLFTSCSLCCQQSTRHLPSRRLHLSRCNSVQLNKNASVQIVKESWKGGSPEPVFNNAAQAWSAHPRDQGLRPRFRSLDHRRAPVMLNICHFSHCFAAL
jgi:Iron/manganese superoxide dismutases, alpha-hairpin domain